MKKKIVTISLMTAIALVAGWNINQNSNKIKFSELILSNIESLAKDGSSECFLDPPYNAYCNIYDTSSACPCGW